MTNIYYCWFGSETPNYVKENVTKWQDIFKNAQFIEINETNFDYNQYLFSKQAYQKKQFAFVSDVARLHFLNEYGGIYLDATVSVKKDFTEDLSAYSQVYGIENYQFEICGVLGAILISKKQNNVFREVLNYYQENEFKIITINQLLTEQLQLIGFKIKNKSQELYYNDQVIKILDTRFFNKGKKSLYAYPNSLSSWQKKLPIHLLIKRYIGKLIKKIIGKKHFSTLTNKKTDK